MLVSQLVAAAPAPAPPPSAAPSPPAALALPAGWQQHPQDPQYAWNPSTGQIVPVSQLVAQQPQQPQAGVPSYGRSQADWGEQSLDAADEAYERSQMRDGILWLNFPDLVKDEASMLLRMLPAWDKSGRNAWVDSQKHRIPARLVPNPPGQSEVVYVECPARSEGGSGQPCAICAVADASQVDGIKEMRARASGIWQAMNLSNPQVHYHTVNGQQMIVPGVFRAPKTLHDDLIQLGRVCRVENGGSGAHFTSPIAGFPVEVIRKRVNNGKRPPMNVEYSVVHHAHRGGPIDPSVFPSYLIDLLFKAKFWRSSEDIAQIAANIQQAFAAPPPQNQQVYVPPGYQQQGWHGQAAAPALPPRGVAQPSGAAPQAPATAWVPPLPPPASALPASAAAPQLPPPQAPGIAPPLPGAAPPLPGAAPPLPGPGMPGGFGAVDDPNKPPF